MKTASLTHLTLAQVRAALAQPLPGLAAQLRMSPRPRPGTERILDPQLDCRRAGVLVLIYPRDGELYLVLTRRTESVDNHRGQISFPGGSLEPAEDAEAAALREAQEELGITPDAVEVLAALSPLYIPNSRFCIYPTVAYAAARPAFVPNPQEVAEVIEVPLALLLEKGIRREETWEIHGAAVQVPFYAVGPHKVWGATAMVLSELVALLQTADGQGAKMKETCFENHVPGTSKVPGT